MHKLVTDCCQRRAMLGYILVCMIICLLMTAKISVLLDSWYPVHNYLVLSDSRFVNVSCDVLFSFPEVNETDAMQVPISQLGRMENIYFLSESGNDSNNEEPEIVSTPSPLSKFHPALSSIERQVLLMVFQKFIQACFSSHITFFLYGGTLIGSFRHHDFVPWDDDIDVMLNYSQRHGLTQALSAVGDEFKLYNPPGVQWKFYWTRPETLPHKPFRWPYIDIFFFDENSTHVWDTLPHYGQDYVYLKKDVFPLVRRPYAGAMLPVPYCTQSVLKQTYSPSLCATNAYSHKMEGYMPDATQAMVPCTHLYRFYPFVFRKYDRNNVIEVLSVGNRTIQTIILPKDCVHDNNEH